MTVADAPRVIRFNGSGTTGPFTFNFRYLTRTNGSPQIELTRYDVDGDPSTLSYPGDFSIVPVSGGISGGIVTLTTALAVGEILVIDGDTDKDQGNDYTQQNGLTPEAVEQGFDKLTCLVQEIVRQQLRALLWDNSLSTSPPTVGQLSANALLQVNAAGTQIVDGPSAGDISNAAANASAAAASAAAAALSAQTLFGTSATSVTIGTGSKSFTTQSGKQFGVGNWLLISDGSNPANFMHGYVTAYSSTSLTVEVTNVGGSGTIADWDIFVSGTRGAQGPAGSPGAGTGDVVGPASSVEKEVALFDGTTGKLLERMTGTGYLKVVSGVAQTPAATVPISDLASIAANTILANATSGSAAATAVAVAAMRFFGRGASGNLGDIIPGSDFTFSGMNLSLNTGTGANQIVKLNGSGQLPAVDGSLLTGISGLPAAVTTALSGSTVTLAADFTTYRAFAIMISRPDKKVAIGASTAGSGGPFTAPNAGNYYLTSENTSNIGLCGFLFQPSTSGNLFFVGMGSAGGAVSQGAGSGFFAMDRINISAAVTHINVYSDGGSYTQGDVILQPIAKR